MTELGVEVLQLLRDGGTPLRSGQLHRLTHKRVGQTLAMLRREGCVMRMLDGTWCITRIGREALTSDNTGAA